MTRFERSLVKAFNRRVEGEALAYRQKQHRYSCQLADIMIDSGNDYLYLSIEAKSMKTQKQSKLYYKSNFSVSKNGHQLKRMKEFLEKSSRSGYIAVELKNGPGHSREAYLVPFTLMYTQWNQDEVGMHVEEIRSHCEIPRNGTDYRISDSVLSFLRKT